MYPWITVDGLADADATGNLEVTNKEMGAELHMKEKSGDGFFDSEDKWQAFFAKLKIEVEKCPTIDFKSLVTVYDCDAFLAKMAERRIAGEIKPFPCAA